VPNDGFTWYGNSYDNTGHLGASTWRHVLFLEQDRQKENQIVGSHSLGNGDGDDPFRWLFLSDVCKHCEEAGCLEACPTGSIVRTEVGSVFVQDDVCNGCGYCLVSCPFGVIDRRPQPLPEARGAFKCTFCYDRQKSGLPPACAKVCPTESIVFGPLDDLRARATQRVQQLREHGYDDAQLYDPIEASVRGAHAFFLILGEPEAYGLPPKPQIPTIYLKAAWTAAFGRGHRCNRSDARKFCVLMKGGVGRNITRGARVPHALCCAPRTTHSKTRHRGDAFRRAAEKSEPGARAPQS
jgi:formate dehydrogenase iron-sulfur subunit